MSPRTQSVSVRDITLKQLAMVLDFSPIPTAILQWDQVSYINPAGLALLDSEEPEQVVLRSILGCEDSDELEEARRKRMVELKKTGDTIFLSQKKWVRREGKWLRQSGETRQLNVSAWSIPLIGGGGTQLTFAEVKAADPADMAELDAGEHLLLAIESAEVGIWDYNPITGKLRWSNRCHEIFGHPWDGEATYPEFLQLLHPEDRPRAEHAMQDSMDPLGRGEFGCDYRILCPDGRVRWIAAKGHAYFSIVNGKRKATRLIGAVLDITELRQADASVRQSEKLDVTGRLAASIAHEINNPLEAITNLLYLLSDSALKEDQHKYVKLAQEELARVADISTQALRFYHDPSAPTKCDLAEITNGALELFGRRITGLQIQVVRRYANESTVLGGREELRQVIVNLVHNAVDAMPHGGRLLVHTSLVRKWSSGRKGVRLTIADTGHGMDRGTLKRIFEPFFTTRPEVSTGLGLWLTTGIIQKHGGSIRVKSRQLPGRSGTVFSIFLPLDRRR